MVSQTGTKNRNNLARNRFVKIGRQTSPKISRFDSNHSIMMVKTSGLQEDFGRVEHVKIPFILPEEEYVERGTLIGFVCFQNLTNTTVLQDFFST
ncbi:hypothetical protein BpHYR1_053120 [Brachionus plicatilis]|uniref:Uncharacterized protein n=1 Tax=Brachionus plicatilis TaxID=10195 RepID=A0A3M7S8R6_BRAPC|nr:hypothetical protein BpHYR1_053120 [Brachionus plicatilis]